MTERIPWGEIYAAATAGYLDGYDWGYLWGTYAMREALEPVATLIRAARPDLAKPAGTIYSVPRERSEC